MTCLPIWLDLARTIGVYLVGGVAAWIAWKQVRVHRDKNKHDLYKKSEELAVWFRELSKKAEEKFVPYMGFNKPD